MIGNFKANLPYNNFLLLIYGLMIKWTLFLQPAIAPLSNEDTFLFKSIHHFISGINSSSGSFTSILIFLLIYIQAIMLNRLASNQKMFLKPNYLIGMTYILVTSLFSSFNTFSSTLLSATILIATLSSLSKLSNTQDPKKIIFNIGIYLGIASFLYFPSIIFLALLFLTLFIMRPFRLAELIILIIGTLTPYYFLYSFNYLLDLNIKGLFPNLSFSMPVIHLNKPEIVGLAFIALLFCVGIYYLQINMNRLLVQSRKMWSVFFLFLMISVLVIFMQQQQTPNFHFIIIPAAMIIAAFFIYTEKRFISSLLHWMLVAFSFVVGYYSL